MTVSKELKKRDLITGKGTLTVFDKIFPKILEKSCDEPSKFIRDRWDLYLKEYCGPEKKKNPALNGHVFEGLLTVLFHLCKVGPLYFQANLKFVPDANFDFIGYSEEHGPIVLSAKTSLRERKKQADLEGRFMRQVYQRSQSYLITLDADEARAANANIDRGGLMGIDRVVSMEDGSFDELIKKLQGMDFCEPEMVQIITGTRIIN